MPMLPMPHSLRTASYYDADSSYFPILYMMAIAVHSCVFVDVCDVKERWHLWSPQDVVGSRHNAVSWRPIVSSPINPPHMNSISSLTLLLARL